MRWLALLGLLLLVPTKLGREQPPGTTGVRAEPRFASDAEDPAPEVRVPQVPAPKVPKPARPDDGGVPSVPSVPPGELPPEPGPQPEDQDPATPEIPDQDYPTPDVPDRKPPERRDGPGEPEDEVRIERVSPDAAPKPKRPAPGI